MKIRFFPIFIITLGIIFLMHNLEVLKFNIHIIFPIALIELGMILMINSVNSNK